MSKIEIDRCAYDAETIFDYYIDGDGNRVDCFDNDAAIAVLLDNSVLFANSRPYLEGDEKMPQTIVLFVNCNDVFAWGCADGEELPLNEVQTLFKMWHEDKSWGAAKWCAIRRNQKPQPPVIEAMKQNGLWSAEMDALGENH